MHIHSQQPHQKRPAQHRFRGREDQLCTAVVIDLQVLFVHRPVGPLSMLYISRINFSTPRHSLPLSIDHATHKMYTVRHTDRYAYPSMKPTTHTPYCIVDTAVVKVTHLRRPAGQRQRHNDSILLLLGFRNASLFHEANDMLRQFECCLKQAGGHERQAGVGGAETSKPGGITVATRRSTDSPSQTYGVYPISFRRRRGEHRVVCVPASARIGTKMEVVIATTPCSRSLYGSSTPAGPGFSVRETATGSASIKLSSVGLTEKLLLDSSRYIERRNGLHPHEILGRTSSPP